MKIRTLLFFPLLMMSCAHQAPVNDQQPNTKLALASSKLLVLPIAPIVGSTISGQQISLGGFSGLVFKEEKDGELIFQANTDRGPTSNLVNSDRPFLLPEFTPEIVTLKTKLKENSLEVSAELKLKKKNGQPLTGLLNSREEEVPVDIFGMPSSIDKEGLDLKGLTYDGEGGYWLADQYAPSLVHFDVEGKMIRRLTPGTELPKIYSERLTNQGFSGIARIENKIFGILQTPLANEPGIARIVEFNLETMRTNFEYFYPFENQKAKIYNFQAINDKSFLVIEDHAIYKITLNGSDQNVNKEFILDLAKTSLQKIEKVKGLAIIDHRRLAIINNNNFQISGKIDFETGVSPVALNKNELLILEFNRDIF